MKVQADAPALAPERYTFMAIPTDMPLFNAISTKDLLPEGHGVARGA